MTEGELFVMDESFSLRSALTDVEKSSPFYISGYFAFKESLVLNNNINFSNLFRENCCVQQQSYLICIVFILLIQQYWKNTHKASTNWFQWNLWNQSIEIQLTKQLLRWFLKGFSRAFPNDLSNKLKARKTSTK